MSSTHKRRAPLDLPPPASAVPKTPAPDVSLEAQLKCAQRELKIRRDVYPAWVRAGRMNKFTAEDEIARMSAIVSTLQSLIAQSSRS